MNPRFNKQQRRILRIAGIVFLLGLIGGALVYGQVGPGWLKTAVQTSSPGAGGACYYTDDAGQVSCALVADEGICGISGSSVSYYDAGEESCLSGANLQLVSEIGVGATDEGAGSACTQELEAQFVLEEEASEGDLVQVLLPQVIGVSLDEITGEWVAVCAMLVKELEASTSSSDFLVPDPSPTLSPTPSDLPPNPFEPLLPLPEDTDEPEEEPLDPSPEATETGQP